MFDNSYLNKKQYKKLITKKIVLKKRNIKLVQEANLYSEEVRRLVNNSYDVGNHKVMFDASLLSSGIYFVQLITDQDIKYSKIMLIK